MEKEKKIIGRRFTFENYDITVVKSSNGKVEMQFTIRTQIMVFGKTYPITFTLSPSDNMNFPVLIERKFLSGKILIENLSYNQKL